VLSTGQPSLMILQWVFSLPMSKSHQRRLCYLPHVYN